MCREVEKIALAERNEGRTEGMVEILLEDGYTVEQIAERLCIDEKTVYMIKERVEQQDS